MATTKAMVCDCSVNSLDSLRTTCIGRENRPPLSKNGTMLLEFAGCSGSGKTTLANAVLSRMRSTGYCAVYSPDLIAKWSRTGWIRNLTIRHLVQNVVLLPWSIRSFHKHFRVCKLAIPLILRGSGGIVGRINCLRSLMRQMASNELLKGSKSQFDLILADENMLGCAHNVFVHIDSPPDLDAVRRYAELVSVPDLFVHIEVPLELAVERTMQRPDPPSRLRRIGRKREQCERFLSHGSTVFKELAAADAFEGRVLSIVNAGGEMEALDLLVDKIVKFILDSKLARQERDIS